jgi:hypothetical protein
LSFGLIRADEGVAPIGLHDTPSVYGIEHAFPGHRCGMSRQMSPEQRRFGVSGH